MLVLNPALSQEESAEARERVRELLTKDDGEILVEDEWGTRNPLASSLAAGGLRIVSGGTDNHLILVDLRPLDVKGNEAEQVLEGVSIVVNKNAIPYDPERPMVTSGLRLGSAAVTSRGFGPSDMEKVGDMIVRALTCNGDAEELKGVKRDAEELASAFPVPGIDS